MTYRPYDPEQLLLLSPALQDWLPAGRLVYFLSDVVDQLDLAAITAVYEQEARGYPPYYPRMMVKLLLYAYAIGVSSSWRIAQRCEEDVAFRVPTANSTPDFRTISDFRKRHLAALQCLFLQVIRWCQEAGLVQLGVVAPDGIKVQANASEHKAMSYGRMQAEVLRLEPEIQQRLTRAEQVDTAQEQRYGADRRGDQLPAELAPRETRLAKIREAMPVLEAEAQAAASARTPAPGHRRARPPKTPPGTPAPTAQRNFTDPESRIMKNADKAFVQAYNAQAAVEATHQIIVACTVTNQAADAPHAVPLADAVIANTGAIPKRLLGDAEYWSETNAAELTARGIDPQLATAKEKHATSPPSSPCNRVPTTLSPKDRMRRKLQTKRVRGFRQFLLRGLAKVQGECALICTGRNLLKLFRSGRWVTA